MHPLLILAVLQSASPPAPPSARLGFEPGADSVLADWTQVSGYMNGLAQQSRFVHVDTLGRTTEGRPFLLMTITSPANQARLAEIKRAQALLADPRRLGDSAFAAIRKTQPAVILISNNIHSTEIASSQMGMTLAYRLATDPELTRLLDSVVVLMIPSMNPDGLDTVVSWYRRYKGTRYEGGPLPWLYHKYVGHDNNRDWFMVTQAETRLVTRMLYTEWFPEVVYDVHQMGASGVRLFVPPFTDPVNPNLDPALVAAMNLVGAQMASALYDAGATGVAHQLTYDLWWHGGFRSTPTRHNMVGILTEAASTRLGSPITLAPDSVRQPMRGVNQPAQWPGGTWHLGDIVRYELIASEALVHLASRDRLTFIDRFVGLGRRAVEAGLAGSPFAYVLPPDQRDPEAWSTLANVLRIGGVEVRRAAEPFTADGRSYPAGSLVVPMAQPYRAHAKDLLEPQQYTPVNDRPPYDVAGWTLPYTMGVRADVVNQPFSANLVNVDSVVPTPGKIQGSGEVFVLRNRTNAESRAVAQLLAAGQSVTVLGDSLIVRGPRARAILTEQAARHGFNVTAVRAAPAGGRTLQRLPRIGLYQPWTGNIDEGWTRWLFEQYGISYTTLHDSDLKKGGLRQRFDVLVLPDAEETALVRGIDSTRIPLQYAGGMGETGANAVSEFVRGGGTLVCLDGSSNFAIAHLNLPVVNVLAGEASGPQVLRFYAPGSIFGVLLGRVEGGSRSPITVGLPDSLQIYFENSAAFSVSGSARALATYPPKPLRSGYARYQERLEGKAALVEIPVGSRGGRVILFGFRPLFRGQTHGTFKLLFNAVLLTAP
ncbi:MAG TPA: M14 metallopeptidase family protein [Gemmatimonadales bacterium]|nr:M14 metallopeptidase family protein [Gemmatimonadales bacterium]